MTLSGSFQNKCRSKPVKLTDIFKPIPIIQVFASGKCIQRSRSIQRASGKDIELLAFSIRMKLFGSGLDLTKNTNE